MLIPKLCDSNCLYRALLPLAEAVSRAHVAFIEWASHSTSPSSTSEDELRDLALVLSSNKTLQIIACYIGAIGLACMNLPLLEKALSQPGDYFRLFSGFTFAYDWWGDMCHIRKR